MAEQHSESDGKISRAQRHLRMGYVSTRHENSKTHMATYYSRTPGLHLKGDWLRKTGFDIGMSVTVKISEGCLTIIADSNEVQEPRNELYQVKQVVKGMKDGMFSVLNKS
ncbi:SymE family type I addiction module toxin [Citrobacter farmeri]|uniref:SymE family type I addiction module toxin n=1 Tax=Citrobacter farmeri TaxID=67824 RepID=UPI000F686CBD|nr:SymE family type I addiction module toxin [Citrobacter farmeri]RSB16911.1 type I toxin-antitoxin system SymE family toxin [Citrobacter farmeri]